MSDLQNDFSSRVESLTQDRSPRLLARKKSDAQKDEAKMEIGAAAKLSESAQVESKSVPQQQFDKLAKGKVFTRSVSPQKEPRAAESQIASVVPSDAEFRQIIGDA